MSEKKTPIVRGTVLHVPYSEKDHAKRLGAHWDPEMKKWFVPRGVDTSPFSQWMAPHSSEQNEERQ